MTEVIKKREHGIGNCFPSSGGNQNQPKTIHAFVPCAFDFKIQAIN